MTRGSGTVLLQSCILFYLLIILTSSPVAFPLFFLRSGLLCIGLPIHCNYQLAHYTGFFEYLGQFLIDFNQIYRHSSVP